LRFGSSCTDPRRVQAQRPRHEELLVEVFGTGTLESKVVTPVSAKIVGKVVDVMVDQGDSVTTGQLLARLENRDFEDAARVAAAQCDQARSELAKAAAEVQRRRSLMQRNLISHEELDTYEATERVAAAQVRNAEAACGVAKAKLADTQIISTASGSVITRNLEMGATVVPGTPIFRIAAHSKALAGYSACDRSRCRRRPADRENGLTTIGPTRHRPHAPRLRGRPLRQGAQRVPIPSGRGLSGTRHE